jgi:hypothetical protein
MSGLELVAWAILGGLAGAALYLLVTGIQAGA